MAELLAGKARLPLSGIPLDSKEEWIRLIYIILYSPSRRAKYLLAGERGKMEALRGGSIEVPALVLQRKEP